MIRLTAALSALLMLSLTLHADSTRVVVNEQVNGGSWNTLGSYFFYAGDAGSVTLKTDGTNGYVVADAILFQKGALQIIIDNNDPVRALRTGIWFSSSITGGYYGFDYLYDGNTLKGQKSVRFNPPLPDSGTYEVFLRWTEGSNRASNMPVDILYKIVPDTFVLTVAGGTGNGSYAQGTRVTLKADAPAAGKTFHRWLANDNSLMTGFAKDSTTFPMPAKALTVTAVYRDTASQVKSFLVENLEMGWPQKIVTYGTSLTAGGAWVRQVDSLLNLRFPGRVTLVNSGLSGQNSRWGVANLRSRVLNQSPDVVFIEFAINDDAAASLLSLDSSRINLNNMIDSILSVNPDCQIIPMTMNPTTWSNRDSLEYYYQMYRDVATQRKRMLVDNYVNWKPVLDTNPTLFSSLVPDGLHPNDNGCWQVTTPEIMRMLDPTQPPVMAESRVTLGKLKLAITPNPFNPAVTFRYSLDLPGDVRIQIINANGTRVKTILGKNEPSGAHQANWDGRDDQGRPMASGTYIIQLLADGKTQTQKAVLMR
ncbi:MAG: GDSL-type esterase/lipase family protein [Fibrobacterota bacterium]